MQNLSNILTIALVSTIWIACGNPSPEQQNSSEPFKNATVIELKKLMAENPDAVLLDVRTPEEFAQGNIEGAVLMDVNDPAFETSVNALDKDKKYLVYCHSGQRSEVACNMMAEKGFKDLTNLVGGYQAWSGN